MMGRDGESPAWIECVPETTQSAPTTAAGPAAAAPRPLLVYDGDCGFCGYWASYWRKLTGDRVDYRPYQDVASQWPSIPIGEFQRAVQYIAPDGRRASGAEASFLTLSHARGRGIWIALYRNLPGFAALSEFVYAFLAAHRPAFHRVSLALWGRNLRSATVRSRFVAVPASIWPDLPVGLRLLRRAGAGADRQPRHSAGRRPGRRSRPADRSEAILADADGVLVELRRSRHPGGLLGRGRPFAAAGVQYPAAHLPGADVPAVSFAPVRRTGVHDLPMGHIPVGDGVSGADSSHRHGGRDLAAALAAVPLLVHVGRGQAVERRSELVESCRRSPIISSRSRCPRLWPGMPRSCRRPC